MFSVVINIVFVVVVVVAIIVADEESSIDFLRSSGFCLSFSSRVSNTCPQLPLCYYIIEKVLCLISVANIY